jgi:hypothetical protein
MANVDRPNGFKLVGTISGTGINGNMRHYNVDSSNATAVFVGDAVKLEADGNVAPAAAGDAVLGVVVGVEVDRSIPETEHPGYIPASTAGRVKVAVGPDYLYEAQEDSVGSNLALTDVGANVDLVAGSGSTTTGQSAHELDSSSVVSTTAQFRIVGLVDREDNEVGTHAKWLVRIHESHWAAAGV